MATGEYHKETFDKDELAALGRAEETAPDAGKDEHEEEPKGPEPKEEPKETPKEEPKAEPKTEPKAEPTAEEKAAAEKQGLHVETDEKGHSYIVDEDGERIPPARWKEMYHAAKEGERTKEKLHLLKTLGPEKFYEVHPEERPADYVPPGQKVNPLDLTATYPQPNHPYQGLTLREIMRKDPDEGHNLLQNYEASQRTKGDIRQKEIAETTAEANEFASIIAKELFSKDSLEALTTEEAQTINGMIAPTYQWGVENGKGKYRLADIWRLKNKADPVKQEKAIKSLEAKPAVKSIGSGGEAPAATGFEAYEAMSEDQLTDKIDDMGEKELKKFFSKAPPSLRKKYPALPWK